MLATYTLQLTASEINLVIRNLTEASHQWRRVLEDNPHLPDTEAYARSEWLALMSVLEKIDPPLGV